MNSKRGMRCINPPFQFLVMMLDEYEEINKEIEEFEKWFHNEIQYGMYYVEYQKYYQKLKRLKQIRRRYEEQLGKG